MNFKEGQTVGLRLPETDEEEVLWVSYHSSYINDIFTITMELNCDYFVLARIKDEKTILCHSKFFVPKNIKKIVG